MGAAVAAAARNLGLRVLGVRRSGKPHELVDEMSSIEQLDSVLPRADFIAFAAPLTDETRSLMNRRRFQLVKNGSARVNVGRAGLVDYDALIESLRDGRLSEAVIDLFEPEPIGATSPLLACEKFDHDTARDLR